MKSIGLTTDAAVLRQKAEARLDKMPPSAPVLTLDDALQLIHELRVRQAELEIQNEELMQVHSAAQDAIDSTDRIEAERTTKLLASVVESSQDAIFTKTLDGIVTSWNRGAEIIYGYRPEEIIDRSISIIFPPEKMNELDQILDRIRREEQIKSYETVRLRKDGTRIHIALTVSPLTDGAGTLTGASVIARDITERKLAEQLLAREKELLFVMFRSIGDGVITTDIKGRIVMLNKAAEEMTGWRSEDAAGRPLPEVLVIVDALTRVPRVNPVDKVLATGTVIELAPHTLLISKDNREIEIADSGAPIRDINSQIIGVVLVFRDLTEKQMLETSQQRTQQLESLGILAGGIAHDFNNMLAGIFGYLDLARECSIANRTADVSKYLDKALGVFNRAKGLTQQLLTFSKGGTPVRTTMSIAQLIQHSAIFALSGSNVSCRFDIADDLWLCECDENQIGQAIDNIVINAKQAMPMGGKIIITAVNVEEALGHPGSFVRISIKDQGLGIPHDILPKIFDPFFSTKTTGHGLGLATVFSIITQHDGWIDVDSQLGVGTTFHLYIPASQKKPKDVLHTGTLRHTGTGTILVMDDEEFILEVVGEMLKEMGYSLVRAKDGKEALALFIDAQQSGQPFAASILDLTIPGGTGGKETAAAMRKIDPNAIIIVSSGYSEDPTIANPTAYGFTDRIVKPYRKDELTELMLRILP